MTGLETAWEKLHGEAARLKPLHLRELFAQDPQRFDTLSARLDDMLIDFSKEKIDAPALEALLALARAAGVERQRDAMFAGEAANTTEGRAALHMALRGGAQLIGRFGLFDGLRGAPESTREMTHVYVTHDMSLGKNRPVMVMYSQYSAPNSHAARRRSSRRAVIESATTP